MSQITKNQHFVPQSLIKHFSKADEVVNVFDSKRNISRPPTTVARVLSENYFYDRDNSVENFLAQKVEGPAAPIFESIVVNPTIPIVCNRADLLRFVTVQLNRTPSALYASLQNIDNFTTSLIRQIGELNGFDEETIESVKFVLDDPKAILGQQTVEGALNWLLLDDLEWHVLINKTDVSFVLSDHPVVHYNWYLRDSNNLAYTSLNSCGLQIFLPISHSVTICLYDKKVYKFGDKNSHFSFVDKTSDILLLNELQFRSRESFIVYDSSAQTDYVIKSCKRYPESSLHNNHSWTSNLEESENDEIRSTHVIYRKQLKLNHWLSMSKVKRRITKKTIECYDRNPVIVERHRKFIEKLRERPKPRAI
ncbi:DUF4238 domain-containing protein [Pseudoalteromonas maricaloris]|uniref:DUF4238 domain-containing protein n=1 Tax=Pseudoalteromonas maricaloris TaxID=184924 RepID=UPI003C2709F2